MNMRLVSEDYIRMYAHLIMHAQVNVGEYCRGSCAEKQVMH